MDDKKVDFSISKDIVVGLCIVFDIAFDDFDSEDLEVILLHRIEEAANHRRNEVFQHQEIVNKFLIKYNPDDPKYQKAE